MRYRRMPIEIESPEQLGYETITNNLSESSVADRRLADLGLDPELDDLLLCYGDHLGDRVLREAIASDGDGLRAEDVLVTPGAAAALFCAATSLLDPGDHAVVVRTNYATNLETPRAIGADVDVVDLAFDDGWQLDVERLAARVRPGTTRLISVTCPHNPTGTMLDLESLHALVGVAEQSGAVLLVDETYRDLTHAGPAGPGGHKQSPAGPGGHKQSPAGPGGHKQGPLPMAASLSTRAISVSSMSKTYGLPGLRVGWAVCRDPTLAETLLAAKEQMLICGPTLDETIAAHVLAARARILPPILDTVRAHLAIVCDWLAGQETFEWVEPTGGVVGLVRVRPEIEIDTACFYRVLLDDYGTYVGPGHWFELDDRHFRLGFGWPTADQLTAGLAGLSGSAEAACV